MVSYIDPDRALKKLLWMFSPHRKMIHTEAPFWRLREDALRSSPLKHDIHGEVLEAVGIESECVRSPRKRQNRGFKEKVLSAYRHQCAVCSFGGRLDDKPVALETGISSGTWPVGPTGCRTHSLCARSTTDYSTRVPSPCRRKEW